jgi:hypothetical protein
VVDRALAARLADASPVDAGVAWSLERLAERVNSVQDADAATA